jgi:hypothetical protein
MKLLIASVLLLSFTAKASPLMPIKERLRLHLWAHGIDEKPEKKQQQKPRFILPEEIERPLRKI